MKSLKTNFINLNYKSHNVLIGILISILLTIISLIIFSIIMESFNIKIETVKSVTIIITLISILIGSIFTKRKRYGAIVGIIYILLMYIISGIISKNSNINLQSFLILVSSIIVGILGGILGANKK